MSLCHYDALFCLCKNRILMNNFYLVLFSTIFQHFPEILQQLSGIDNQVPAMSGYTSHLHTIFSQ